MKFIFSILMFWWLWVVVIFMCGDGCQKAHAAIPIDINGVAHVALSFDYSTNDIDLGDTNDPLWFYTIGTTNLSVPYTNWTWVGYKGRDIVTATNDNLYSFSITNPILPGAYYWTAVASNSTWGCSSTSNFAWTPPVPKTPTLKIKKQ